jgi:U32 family peptidase
MARNLELLSPAGSEEKLRFAYRYGADAAYIGLDSFSLRARADNFSLDGGTEGSEGRAVPALAQRLLQIKKTAGGRAEVKRLYGAFNIYFRTPELKALEEELEKIALLPFDALIVSDIGAYSLLRRRLPRHRFHLSTQANCINAEAVKAYRDLGFSRIVLGREVTLAEIEDIRREVADIELEAFVHGAMCLAYSGRCFLSAYLTGRSANTGDCTHSCRWHYRLLEEKERPGEYFPVIEEDGRSTILSSKDLNMFDHLRRLRDAGIDAVKIEGRMKGVYYTAVVTKAYRTALDRIDETDDEVLAIQRHELENVSHRRYSTGFYFGERDADETTGDSYLRSYEFLGIVGESADSKLPGSKRRRYSLEVRNSIIEGEPIEFVGPEGPVLEDRAFTLFDHAGERITRADRGPKSCYIETSAPIARDYLIRKKRPL